MSLIKNSGIDELILLVNTTQVTGNRFPFFFDEYYSKSVVNSFISSIKKFFPNSSYLEADEGAYEVLHSKKKKGHLPFVINISEGFRGKDREAQFSGILELLDIPYSGGSPLNKSLLFDKIKTKEVLLSNGLPTPRYHIIRSVDDFDLNDVKFNFPMFVKPSKEGSSLGIDENSLVNNYDELIKKSKKILSDFKHPVLVEEYLSGEEYTVSLLGNEILPLIETVNFAKFGSNYAKLNGLCEYSSVTDISDEQKKYFLEIAKKAFAVTESFDFARLDIRCDQHKKPYILEINSPCAISLSDKTSFGVARKASNYSISDVFLKMTESALSRYYVE